MAESTSDVTASTPAERGAKRDGRSNPFARLLRFFREVVAELRKVIWPTRKELITYTAVVVVFVAIMVSIVALLDLAFAKAVLAVFGTGKGAAG
ncbi:MAG: preprotein translocase, SecE subunit [Cryptosporangiaceae bacterium]|nr:preprotein translocase, SecE subunit [Cryptosporangiaceae bacterium]